MNSIINKINDLYKRHNDGVIAVIFDESNDKLNAIHLNYIGENVIYNHIAKDSLDIFGKPIKTPSDNYVICYVGLIDNLQEHNSISKSEYKLLIWNLKDSVRFTVNEPNNIKSVCSNEQTNTLKLSTRRITNE